VSTTILLYICLSVLLLAITVFLVMRDLNAAAAEREKERGVVEPTLQRLPTPVEEMRPGPFTDRIDHSFRRLIYQTGMDITAEPAFLLMVLCGLALGGGILVWRDEPVPAALGMLIGMAVPLGYFMFRRRQRMTAIREQLPDVMDLMSRSVRAGETLDQAIDNVGRSASDPLGIEFRRCARQLEMGLGLPATMRALTYRAPITEMRILSTAVNVQRRTGGNLANTLERLSGVVRDRLSYQRQFIAMTGASRMATILIALAGPAVFAFMMFGQPDYMGQFFTIAGGWTLLLIAGVLQVIGLVWVWGLLRNDY
jgi:tight adherence protein B